MKKFMTLDEEFTDLISFLWDCRGKKKRILWTKDVAKH